MNIFCCVVGDIVEILKLNFQDVSHNHRILTTVCLGCGGVCSALGITHHICKWAQLEIGVCKDRGTECLLY